MNDNFCQLWPTTDITVVKYNSWPFFYTTRSLAFESRADIDNTFVPDHSTPLIHFLLYRCLFYIDLASTNCRGLQGRQGYKTNKGNQADPQLLQSLAHCQMRPRAPWIFWNTWNSEKPGEAWSFLQHHLSNSFGDIQVTDHFKIKALEMPSSC